MVNPVRASEILNKIKLSLLCFSVTHRSFAFHSLYKTQGRFIYTIYREKYHYWFSKNFLHVLTIVLLRVREAVEYITPPGGRVREQQIGDRRAPLLTKIKLSWSDPKHVQFLIPLNKSQQPSLRKRGIDIRILQVISSLIRLSMGILRRVCSYSPCAFLFTTIAIFWLVAICEIGGAIKNPKPQSLAYIISLRI